MTNLSYTQGPVARARQAHISNKIRLFTKAVINSRTIDEWIQKHQIARLGYNFPNPIYILAGLQQDKMFFLVIIQFKQELVNVNSVIWTTEKVRQHDYINLFQFYDLQPIKWDRRSLNKLQVPYKLKRTTFFSHPLSLIQPLNLFQYLPLPPKDTPVQDQAPRLED